MSPSLVLPVDAGRLGRGMFDLEPCCQCAALSFEMSVTEKHPNEDVLLSLGHRQQRLLLAQLQRVHGRSCRLEVISASICMSPCRSDHPITRCKCNGALVVVVGVGGQEPPNLLIVRTGQIVTAHVENPKYGL